MRFTGFVAIVVLAVSGLAVLELPASALGMDLPAPYARALTSVPGTGRTYTAVGFAWHQADGFYLGKNRFGFTATPGVFGSTRLAQRGGWIYHEYGLSDVSAVSVQLPYISTSQFIWNGVRQPSRNGVGDITARYRYLVVNDGYQVSVATGFKAAGSENPLMLNSWGKGQTDIFLQGAASTIIVYDIFAELSAGYRWRMGLPDNDMEVGMEVGWKSPHGFTPRAFYNIQYAVGGIDINSTAFNAVAATTGLPATREERRVWGLGLNYEHKTLNFGLTYSDVAVGRNTDDGQTLSASVGMKY